MLTLLSILSDVALGGMAYHLARQVAATQRDMAVVLKDLSIRVVKLENGHNTPSKAPLGFLVDEVE